MNDSPAASIAFWLASETMPASATTVTSGSRWAAMNASMTGSMVLVSALFPSNAETISGNPAASGEQADGDLRLQAALLGEPGLAEPVALVGLEVQRGHVVEDQAGRAQAGMGGAGRGQLLPPGLLRVGRQPALQGAIRRRGQAPASSSTRALSSLLVGSMIRASTSCRNTSSPPAAAAKPSTS